jgi:hypothetical protein
VIQQFHKKENMTGFILELLALTFLTLALLVQFRERVFCFRAKPENKIHLPIYASEASIIKARITRLSFLDNPIFKVVLVFMLFNSCVKENPVPAYLYIPSFSLTAKTSEGSSAQKITDAWVYVDGEINGVFQMPITLPVVEMGQHEISIFAGVRNNGTKSNPVIYPFFNTFIQKIDLKAGKTDTIRPSTTYITNAQFKIMEDFEKGNILRFDRDGNTTLNFTTIDNGFEGRSGQIILTKTNASMEKATTTKVALPNTAENIYLEMNYKTEAELSIGIIGSDPVTNISGTASYKITLFPNKEWNKTYINLTNEVKDLKMTNFQIVFRSLLPDSLNSATILIDNIKLIQK